MEKKTGDLDTFKKNKAIMELYEPLLDEIEDRLKGYYDERDKEEKGSVKYEAYDDLINKTMEIQADVFKKLNFFLNH